MYLFTLYRHSNLCPLIIFPWTKDLGQFEDSRLIFFPLLTVEGRGFLPDEGMTQLSHTLLRPPRASVPASLAYLHPLSFSCLLVSPPFCNNCQGLHIWLRRGGEENVSVFHVGLFASFHWQFNEPASVETTFRSRGYLARVFGKD